MVFGGVPVLTAKRWSDDAYQLRLMMNAIREIIGVGPLYEDANKPTATHRWGVELTEASYAGHPSRTARKKAA